MLRGSVPRYDQETDPKLFCSMISSISYVPLVAPSTSIARVKFLASIADSFIYVVSKVGLCGQLPQLAHIKRPFSSY